MIIHGNQLLPIQLCLWITIFQITVESVCYGHLATSHKCANYQGVLIFQVIQHYLGPLISVNYASILINMFHCVMFMYKILYVATCSSSSVIPRVHNIYTEVYIYELRIYIMNSW